MTDEQQAVPVAQIDREAAAKLYEWFPAMSSSRDAGLKTAQFVRDGGADGWSTVQHFARHRIASLPCKSGEGAGEREALERIRDLSAVWPLSLVSQIHEIACEGLREEPTSLPGAGRHAEGPSFMADRTWPDCLDPNASHNRRERRVSPASSKRGPGDELVFDAWTRDEYNAMVAAEQRNGGPCYTDVPDGNGNWIANPALTPDATQTREAEFRSALIDSLSAELDGSYDCGRVWPAWSYGTMGEDDFSPITDRVEEIADGIIAALNARGGA